MVRGAAVVRPETTQLPVVRSYTYVGRLGVRRVDAGATLGRGDGVGDGSGAGEGLAYTHIPRAASNVYGNVGAALGAVVSGVLAVADVEVPEGIKRGWARQA